MSRTRDTLEAAGKWPEGWLLEAMRGIAKQILDEEGIEIFDVGNGIDYVHLSLEDLIEIMIGVATSTAASATSISRATRRI